jgi:tRNA dimethylallyltransferase
MQFMDKLILPPLIIILGPTGVGKTEVSLELAERLGGEIISADSRLFYRGMDIGTAKPSPLERQRVPHHLIDVTTPDQSWSLAVFQREARRTIGEIQARGHLPFLVGGTGQYIRAVIEEWDLPQVEPNPRLRRALQNWADEIGFQELHSRLAVLDAQAAASIDPRNIRRNLRALEVILTTGKRFSEQRRRGRVLYHHLQLGISRPRAELYERIDARIRRMLENGLVGEVQDLLSKGYSADLPPLSAIGYREIMAYIQGKITLEAAEIEMKRATRIYVRRQANWFKANDPDIHWLPANPKIVDQMEAIIRNWLETI